MKSVCGSNLELEERSLVEMVNYVKSHRSVLDGPTKIEAKPQPTLTAQLGDVKHQ
jgi:hypothetical protein